MLHAVDCYVKLWVWGPPSHLKPGSGNARMQTVMDGKEFNPESCTCSFCPQMVRHRLDLLLSGLCAATGQVKPRSARGFYTPPPLRPSRMQVQRTVMLPFLADTPQRNHYPAVCFIFDKMYLRRRAFGPRISSNQSSRGIVFRKIKGESLR